MNPDDRVSRRHALGILAAPLTLPLVMACRDAFAPRSGPMFSSAAGHVTLVGAGDQHAKAVDLRSRQRTADMIQSVLDGDPTAWAFNAGDLTQHGTQQELASYYEPTWGAFKDRTLFTMGNHDRLNGTASAYDAYTGAESYYARNLGEQWRLYVLNTEGEQNGGTNAVDQIPWLREDVAQHSDKRKILLCHLPLFSNVCATNRKAMTSPWKVGPWWDIFQQNGGEFAIAGHVHRWERFAKALRNGTRSDQGMRQFVTGTGGVKTMDVLSRHPLYERAVVSRGVAQFDLHPDHYEWRFTDLTGVVRDSGTQVCRKAVAA